MDAVIAIGGSWGTLSEIALAKRHGTIPVIIHDYGDGAAAFRRGGVS